MSVYRTLMDTVRVHIPTYFWFLTPWGRLILEKLTAALLLKKYGVLHGIKSFVTVFTAARRWSLSSTS